MIRAAADVPLLRLVGDTAALRESKAQPAALHRPKAEAVAKAGTAGGPRPQRCANHDDVE